MSPWRRRLAGLLRDPQRYTSQVGQEHYDIMLGDCLWHVYRMIGKLSPRVYLLSPSVTSWPRPNHPAVRARLGDV